MSETGGNKQVPVNLGVALREWPDAGKRQEDQGHWENQARSIMDRVERGDRGATTPSVSDEHLLTEPLGHSAEDGHNSATARGAEAVYSAKPASREEKKMTMSADRERDRRSLQDLAKMAQGLTPPPASVVPAIPSAPSGVIRAAEAKADDSGLVDLAAASTADPGAAMRAQNTALASQGLFEEEAPKSQQLQAAPVSARQTPSAATLPAQPPPSVAPPPVSAAAPQVMAPAYAPAAPEKKKSGGAVIALVIGGVVALSAAAAGGLFYMKSQKAAAEAAAAAAAAKPAAPPVVVAAADPTPAPAKAEAPTEPAPAAEPTPSEPAKVAAKTPAKGGAIAAAKPAAAPAAKPEGPAKMTEKDLGAVAAGPAGDLGAAMKKEVGDDAPKTQAAAATGANAATGNVPTKPSQGAVTGAIGAVLPGARACLGPDDPVSRASIVFTSAGTVQGVNVSGAAAGKPAEACIKGALMKAKIAPFAEPTYTANITVRHN